MFRLGCANNFKLKQLVQVETPNKIMSAERHHDIHWQLLSTSIIHLGPSLSPISNGSPSLPAYEKRVLSMSGE